MNRMLVAMLASVAAALAGCATSTGTPPGLHSDSPETRSVSSATRSPGTGKGFNGEFRDADSIGKVLHCTVFPRYNPADVAQVQGSKPVEAGECQGDEWNYNIEIWTDRLNSAQALLAWSHKMAAGRHELVLRGDTWWVYAIEHNGKPVTAQELKSSALAVQVELGGDIYWIPS